MKKEIMNLKKNRTGLMGDYGRQRQENQEL